MKSTNLLHPLVMLRVASEPANLIRSDGRTAALLADCVSLERTLRETGAQLTHALEACLPGLADGMLGRVVLQAKRDTFNVRSTSAANLRALRDILSAELNAQLVAFNEEIARLKANRAALASVHQDELDAGLPALREIAQRRNLQHGVSYSNPDLYDEFQKLFVSGDHHYDGKKRRNLEDTLLQYALRCATKISPLSSFTLVQISAWSTLDDTATQMDFSASIESRTELKAALARQLLHPLLADYPTVREHWPLRLNRTLRPVGDRLGWRTVAPGSLATGRTFGTGESQVQIKFNAVIQCAYHVFAKSGAGTMTAEALVAAICALAPKLAAPAVDGVIRQLFELGALQLDTGFYEQQNPLETIQAFLARRSGDEARAHEAIVANIQAQLDELGSAEAARRAALVKAVRKEISSLALALQVTLDPKIASPAFFENCYLQAPQRSLSWTALRPFQADLAFLLEMAPLLDFNQRVRSNLADAFLARFGEHGQCGDSEAFIREFDEQYRPGQTFGPQANDTAIPPSDLTRRHFAAMEAFKALLGKTLREGANTELDRAAVATILAWLPEQVRNRGGSHSFQGQLCQRDGDQPKFVINQVLGGRSSMLSRFLESVSDADLAQVRQYTKASSQYRRYAAVPGVFGFNANRHPRLAESEIAVAPFADGWTDTEKIPFESLRLRYDAAQHSVTFHTPDGKALDIWYQGFLIPSLLPSVQRVIALAATEGHINFPFTAIMGSEAISGDKISVLPRISLGNLVLLRRTHVFPTTFLPSAELAPLDFFLAFQAWRNQHGLPKSFYVRQLPLDVDPATNMSWWSLNPKDMKPFYVRHDDPRLVRLMQRAMKKNHLPLFISEALPDLDDQHVNVNGQAHVAEIQFELSRPAAAKRASEQHGADALQPVEA